MTDSLYLTLHTGPLVLLELSENLLSLGASRRDVTDHVESTWVMLVWVQSVEAAYKLTLGKIVTLAVQDSLERPDGLLDVDELTLNTGEDLGDSERLAQEPLDLTGTLDGKLVSF